MRVNVVAVLLLETTDVCNGGLTHFTEDDPWVIGSKGGLACCSVTQGRGGGSSLEG